MWSFLTGGMSTAPAALPPLGSPFSGQSHLESMIVGDILGEIPDEVVTPELALRVPEVKRALQAHTSLVAPLKFAVHDNGSSTPRDTQPYWVENCAYPAVSPYLRWKGCVSDLFLYGWALLGAEVGEGDLPRDMIHIPRTLWDFTKEGGVEVNEAIPANYRQRLILIPLGANGLFIDGIDSIRQARKLEHARQRRLDAPPPATELHITDARFDEMTTDEKRQLSKDYSENRKDYSTSVTPSYMEVKDHSSTGTVDLFESGMNSLRIQLAMHGGVPASFLEAGKEGGSAGAMSYSNEGDRQSELWIFGSAEFAYAITSRLSLPDVVGENAEVRADLSAFAVPAPTTLTPETAPEPETPGAIND